MSIVGSTPPTGRRIRSSTPPPRRLSRTLGYLASPTHSLQNQPVSSVSSCQDPNPCPYPLPSTRYHPLRSKRRDSTTDDEDDDDNDDAFFDDRADNESTALVTAVVSSPVTKRREGADVRKRERGDTKSKEGDKRGREEGKDRKDTFDTESLKGRRKVEDWFGKSGKMMVDTMGEEERGVMLSNESGGGGRDGGNGSRRTDENARCLRSMGRRVSLDSGEVFPLTDRSEESIQPPSYNAIFKENISSGRHAAPVQSHRADAGSIGSNGETTTSTLLQRRPQHRHRLVRQLSDAVSVATLPSPCLPRSDSVKFCRAAANGNAQRSYGLGCASGSSHASGMAGSNPASGAGGGGGGGGGEHARGPRRAPSLKLKRLHVQQNSRGGIGGLDSRGGGGADTETGAGVGVSEKGGIISTCTDGNTGDSAPGTGTGKQQTNAGGNGGHLNTTATTGGAGSGGPPSSSHVNPSITITLDSDSDSVYSDYLSPEINYRNHHQDQRVKFLGETHSSTLYGSPVREEQLSPGSESATGNSNNSNGNGPGGGSEGGATKVSSTTSYLKEQIMNFFQPSDNKLAMKLFGNKHALIKEKMRHKRVGNWVIHPCSNFR
ncbi:potassium/sodium hyperpolarization-activated cyclic nucleotide-gated channel 2 [Plakobranchus ocellatus]|uniref:Potassium/sodium hyperpolarization-activated cyclic nucleotide-gated channel 2 n=1 Tax=Plakobranchus ocellatus TaxID=259542 RepID=A0AAV4AXW7_9GAST|nr:potassium/sodium hyperpolarization-activated cyclic nucleotide-gated channel 2 [Plakobranchus ocellatus]